MTSLERHFMDYLDAWDRYDARDETAEKLNKRIKTKLNNRRSSEQLRPTTLREVFADERH